MKIPDRPKCSYCKNEDCKKKIAESIKQNLKAIKRGEGITFHSYDEFKKHFLNQRK